MWPVMRASSGVKFANRWLLHPLPPSLPPQATGSAAASAGDKTTLSKAAHHCCHLAPKLATHTHTNTPACAKLGEGKSGFQTPRLTIK